MSRSLGLVGIDWGTSNFRLLIVNDQGKVELVRTTADGLAQMSREKILPYLETALLDFGDLPVLMCGMIGSSLGLQEVKYIDCPVSTAQLARSVTQIGQAGSSETHLHIVPGVRYEGVDGVPDVMRGEEVQVAGWLSVEANHNIGEHLLCLPGTHSKWVRISNGTIESVKTALTGELYSLLAEHSVLVSGSQEWSDADFSEGVLFAKQKSGLLSQLFSTRARVVAAGHSAQFAASYLSGLLIGKELMEMCTLNRDAVHFIGGEELVQRYNLAASIVGIRNRDWDGGALVASGLHEIWSAYGK